MHNSSIYPILPTRSHHSIVGFPTHFTCSTTYIVHKFLQDDLTKYTALILDLGHVLFTWSPNTNTALLTTCLKKVLSSPVWFEYECGHLSENDFYNRVANQFSLEASEVANAFAQARDTLRANDELISAVRELKSASDGKLRVYVMSNISSPDYEVLRAKPADWLIFDHVFTSSAFGQRKPNLSFFRHVLDSTRCAPQNTIFVDDNPENVLSAQSLGLYGIVFDNTLKVARTLRNLVSDPVKRGKAFLDLNAGNLKSMTDSNVIYGENFTQLLILEATNKR